MNKFVTIRPLLDFPLNNFPNVPGRYGELYDIRGTASHKDGYFLILCDKEDHLEASFPLMGSNAGAYLLGRIVQCPSRSLQGKMYYEIFIHGGVVDATRFCETAEELADTLRKVEAEGQSYLLGSDDWEATEASPFDDIFTEFPNDLRFVLLFGPHALTGDNVKMEEEEE